MSPLERINAIRDLRAPRVRAFEKVVLFALASRANVTGCSWPSIKRLGEDAGMGETAARKAVRTLHALGLIRIESVTGRPSNYWLVDDAIAASSSRHAPRDTNPVRVARRVVRVARGRGSRREPEGDHEVDHKGDHLRDGGTTESDPVPKHTRDGPARVMAHFRKQFEATKGCAPSSATTPRNHAAAAKLLEHHSAGEVLTMIDRAFADAWFVRNQGQLSQIASNPDRWRGSATHAPGRTLQAADLELVAELERGAP